MKRAPTLKIRGRPISAFKRPQEKPGEPQDGPREHVDSYPKCGAWTDLCARLTGSMLAKVREIDGLAPRLGPV